jgi:uncharacterized membrane protein YkvA (DUF1232 family)
MRRRLADWARVARRDALAAWLAARDPRTPWLAKAAAFAVAAYAFSPLDIIPDFVPVLGLLDDAILLPLGVALVAALVPEGLMAELRAEASRRLDRPASRLGAAVVIAIWLAALAGGAWLVAAAL